MEDKNLPPVPPVTRAAPPIDAVAPDGSEIRLLVSNGAHIARASLVEVTLAAGQVSRPVWHRRVEEIWYILEGRGQVWRCPPDADPKTVAAATVIAGDTLTIPTGWRFQFRSSPQTPLRFLCFTSPPWPGDNEALPADVGGLGPPTV